MEHIEHTKPKHLGVDVIGVVGSGKTVEMINEMEKMLIQGHLKKGDTVVIVGCLPAGKTAMLMEEALKKMKEADVIVIEQAEQMVMPIRNIPILQAHEPLFMEPMKKLPPTGGPMGAIEKKRRW